MARIQASKRPSGGGRKTEDGAASPSGLPPLDPGLYLVSTPIGNAADITLRALDVLARADVLAAEDTRTARRLMEIHGVALGGRPLIAYHDHSGEGRREQVLAHLRAGRSVALASEAGAPLVADPGYKLAERAIAEGLPVTSAPGASAVIAALSVAGLPTDRFLFAGFPPPKTGALRRELAELARIDATLVFFESPRRLAATLAEMAAALGAARPAAICRELTKKFESVERGALSDLAAAHARTPPPKGEIVIVVGPPAAQAPETSDLDALLMAALARMSVKDAVKSVADLTGAPRREIYARALEMDAGG
jgi:16S rRNA (cytidine1402-2'-O)-methyltransferase